MTSQSLNINPHNISPNRTRSPLNISDYCVENRSGSCSEVENTSISANPTTSNSTNIILATSFHNRARLTLTNSSHCIENRAGSHLEIEITATSKTTPIKPIRRSMRQLMVRNENDYIEHVKAYDTRKIICMYERHIFNLVLKNLKSWTVLLNNRMPRLLYTSNISLFIFCFLFSFFFKAWLP